MNQVYQLRVALAVAGGDAVCQGAGGVQGGQAGDAKLHRAAVQGDVVAHGSVFHRAGVDDELQARCFTAEYLVRFKAFDRKPCPGDGGGGTFGAAETQPQLMEAPRQVQDLGVVCRLHAQENLVPG